MLEHTPLDSRRAGVVLHPTSLPGPGRHGVLGVQAYYFVDWLLSSGLTVWQMLPLGPTHDDGSPYQCLSAHAGNPDLICTQKLHERGWLPWSPQDQCETNNDHYAILKASFNHWRINATADDRDSHARFVANQKSWLPDFALYIAIRDDHGGACWSQWPVGLRDRESGELEHARKMLKEAIDLIYFTQFVFYEQWHELKRYANQRGIILFGDMPIFVAYDSADVWAHRNNFLLDPQGQPTVVAGVPPDYFSDTGQRWGNPLYNWEAQQANDFDWWLARFRTQLALFDLIRVDHFRGFDAYWEINATCDSAIEGRWIKAAGDALFHMMRQELGQLPLVAEDLGIITEEVVALREKYQLPGMKILQFAFGDGAKNPYLPHQHHSNSVVYTGTHDNDTTLGWYTALPPAVKHHIQEYLGHSSEKMPWALIRAAFRSIARLTVVPLQDFLELDSQSRMNKPGTTEGNWCWRFNWDQVDGDLAPRIKHLVELYGRTGHNNS